jgi:hypothetical protein
MSIASVLSRLAKTLPAILAAAPGVIDAAKQVQEALRKPKTPSPRSSESGGAAAGRLSADSERAAR